MKEMQFQAYELICKCQKPYPQKWDENQQADSEWLKRFEIRHSHEISKFSLDCRLSKLSKTLQGGKYILSKFNSTIMQLHCDCKTWAFNQLQYIAYIARSEMKLYPIVGGCSEGGNVFSGWENSNIQR